VLEPLFSFVELTIKTLKDKIKEYEAKIDTEVQVGEFGEPNCK